MRNDRKIRVLLVAEATGGGVRRHLLDLLDGLDREQFCVALAYGTERADVCFREALPRLTGEGVTLFAIPSLGRSLSPARDLRALSGIVAAVRAFSPDILHCHSAKAGALGRIAAMICRVETVFYTPHAYSFEDPALSTGRQEFYRRIERALSRMATTLTLNVSQGERDCALAAGLDLPGKFRVVYNGIGEAKGMSGRLRPLLGLDPGAVVVGCAARIDAQKDPDTFLQMVQRIAQEKDAPFFVWIGDGPMAGRLRQERDRLGLSSRLLLPGFLPDADELVGELDCYLSTSRYEGMPYAPIEALRAGVPVIATDVIGNREIAVPGQSGCLFPPQDAAAGAALLLSELRQPTISSEGARRLFEERFSLAQMLSEIESLYRQAVERQAAPQPAGTAGR
ncbi:MAG: glycosyltransferase family 1 protein [Oscillospiraceae bacterium]|nr:MAG: glycosyltransferase family 1 protein [Oscillospiraceae bacterium]